jgi:hypothetical protein
VTIAVMVSEPLAQRALARSCGSVDCDNHGSHVRQSGRDGQDRGSRVIGSPSRRPMASPPRNVNSVGRTDARQMRPNVPRRGRRSPLS